MILLALVPTLRHKNHSTMPIMPQTAGQVTVPHLSGHSTKQEVVTQKRTKSRIGGIRLSDQAAVGQA
jgi:hypothetical protein